MSVFNIALSADFALTASDTMVYRRKQAVRLTDRKVHIAPSGRFVVSVRGSVMEAQAVAETLFSHADTFDAAAAFLSRLGGLNDAEINIVGWSDAAGTVRALQAVHDKHRGVTRRELSPGVHLHPSPATRPVKLPERADEALMVRLCMAQHKASIELDMRMCIGGVLHLTTVTEAGCEQRIVATYPDYAQHAARFGCPNADLVAALVEPARAAA